MNQYTLKQELKNLEGILNQNPETGRKTITSYVDKYTNRVFGAPYQFLDSVDKRFKGVNEHLGSEYLRNFMLNAPILRIRPGMPKYTGGDGADSIFSMLKKLYFANDSDLSGVQSLLTMLSRSTIFSAGSRLQRRMYGFRETYYDYMQHVNYMCRSCAVFMELTETDRYPNGAFPSNSDEMQEFSTFKWENYRMIDGSGGTKPSEHLKDMIGSTFDKLVKTIFGGHIDKITNGEGLANWLYSSLGGDESDLLNIEDEIANIDFANESVYDGPVGVIENKITAVEFMIEPTSFEETLSNDTANSFVEDTVDALKDSVGAEIGWITNSNSDTGAVGQMIDFLGSTAENATTSLAGMVEGVTGGFVSNIFSGAVQSIKGQKMIYPEIYKSSNSAMNYNFSVVLTTPYGDPYNYYMDILVPLMHLIGLVAPRMVTANTVASPYLVQAYLPGQCTCQLGIIQNMTITKNPNSSKVSVNGFPLEVKVTFTIKELYNALGKNVSEFENNRLKEEKINKTKKRLEKLQLGIKEYINNNLYDKDSNSYLRNTEDQKMDISMIGAVTPFNVFKPKEKKIVNTVEKINLTLRTYTGGYQRFEQDHYMNGNPWPIANLWMTLYYLETGEKRKAKETFDFVVKTAGKHYLLGEQIDNNTLKPCWVLGLGWSHAMFIIVLEKLYGKN